MKIKWSKTSVFITAVSCIFLIVSIILSVQKSSDNANVSRVLGQNSSQNLSSQTSSFNKNSSFSSYSSTSISSSSSNFSSENLVVLTQNQTSSSKKSNQGSVPPKRENNIILQGYNCNGWEGYLDYGLCKKVDNGQETARIYFDANGASLTPPSKDAFKPMAGGVYPYIEKIGKTDNLQYIRYGVELIEGVSLYAKIYSYDFATKKLSYVDELNFNFYSYFNNNHDLIKSYSVGSCVDPNNETYWDITCFYVLENAIWAPSLPSSKRYDLTQEEKSRIIAAKEAYFKYTQKAAIYGLPDLQLAKSLS